MADADLADLPVNGGEWRALTLTVAGANAAADADGNAADVSFRGVALTENSSRTDGASGDQSFSGAAAGTGVDEEVETGSDEVGDRAAGVGSGSGSVADGGQRAGAAYVFSQASVREFRVPGAGKCGRLWLRAIRTRSGRSGDDRLPLRRHALAWMVFYTLRQSAWAAANPFSVQSNYVNGVVTSSVVKPPDQRQQFGGSIGGPVPGFHSSTNDGSWTRSNAEPGAAALLFLCIRSAAAKFSRNLRSGLCRVLFVDGSPDGAAGESRSHLGPDQYSAELSRQSHRNGAPAARTRQSTSGAWTGSAEAASRVVLEYNRARWNSPAGARSEAVVDRAVASLGSSYGKVDAGVARWVQFLNHGLSNELRMQYGRQLQYESPQTPLPQEPNIGPGGMPPEVSIGPQGLVFGTPSALGQKAYPDERRFEVADLMGWLRGRHFLQFGGRLQRHPRLHRFADQRRGNLQLRQQHDNEGGRACRVGRAGGLDHGLHLQREHVSQRRVSA